MASHSMACFNYRLRHNRKLNSPHRADFVQLHLSALIKHTCVCLTRKEQGRPAGGPKLYIFVTRREAERAGQVKQIEFAGTGSTSSKDPFIKVSFFFFCGTGVKIWAPATLLEAPRFFRGAINDIILLRIDRQWARVPALYKRGQA